jgi:DNA-binding transcriptional MerR regulator
MTDAAEQGNSRTRRAAKSPGAFRTISEVASELEVPQHVLRFWEGKFSQVRPLKRGGGRRYYRPEDVELLRRIRRLLYSEGYTIRGVQKVLRDGPKQADGSANGSGTGGLSSEQKKILAGVVDDLASLHDILARRRV